MSAPASSKVIQLRRLLSEKFPEAHAGRAEVRDTFETGVAALDRAGLPKFELTEAIAASPGTGGASLVAALIEAAPETRRHIALVDGGDGFDPQSVSAAARRNLLWIRCRGALEAAKAADLVLRDGNLPFVLIDLHVNAAAEVRRLGSPVWYRLQTLGRSTATTTLVLTSAKVVSSARLRLTLGHRHTLDDLDVRRDTLIERLRVNVTRRREIAAPLETGHAVEAG